MWKSPTGVALGAAAVWLALSPGARKTARKWAVKATQYVLEWSEQAKGAAEEVRGRFQAAAENTADRLRN